MKCDAGSFIALMLNVLLFLQLFVNFGAGNILNIEWQTVVLEKLCHQIYSEFKSDFNLELWIFCINHTNKSSFPWKVTQYQFSLYTHCFSTVIIIWSYAWCLCYSYNFALEVLDIFLYLVRCNCHCSIE